MAPTVDFEKKTKMNACQPGILAPVPSHARHLFFALASPAALKSALDALRHADGDALVVGIGAPLVRALDAQLAGLRVFPAISQAPIEVPSTQQALWCWLRGGDRGELLHRSRELVKAVSPAFALTKSTEVFLYKTGHDLTGYEDGTENPKQEAAVEAAIVGPGGPGPEGGSFAAVQQWTHDLDRFAAMTGKERDEIMGRRLSDNEEIDDAPQSAHVKRTAQESFTPEAFVLRRSMPWSEGSEAGLMFLAFGHSLDAFEAQLRRMCGLDDGISDGLFRFSHPVTGGYYWCPPLANGELDFRALKE